MNKEFSDEICKNCQEELKGKFCSNCGQKKFDRSQKTIVHLLHDGFHFITHLEGNIFTTIKTVFTKPGKLSLDYANGVQKRYFKPVSMFLIIVIAYLLFPFMQGMNMGLSGHKNMFLYGNYASKKVASIVEEGKYTESEFSDLYAQKSVKVSKPLIMVLIPISVLFLYLLFYKTHKMAYDHWLVSVEFNSFYLAFSYLLLPIIFFPIIKIPKLAFLNSDQYFSAISTILTIAYTTVGFKRFYAQNWLMSGFKAFVFVAVHFIIGQTFYRFLQFQITVWLI